MTIQLWFHVYLTIKTPTVDNVARKIGNFFDFLLKYYEHYLLMYRWKF